MARNGIMFQYFEWFMDENKDLWRRLKEDAEHLEQMGVTGVWIPPAFKASSDHDVGYGSYDLYDLGEFDQKGSVKTKYGSKAELIEAVSALHEHGIQVYADVVLNHKANGDETETFLAREMDPEDRNRPISEPYEIEAWTRFTFPGRGDTHSAFKWSWVHFSGTDYNAKDHKQAIYRIEGENKGWAEGVAYEKGNFDYLMFHDIDYKHPDVVAEIRSWARWFVNETGIDGIRLDGAKHINDFFVRDLLLMLRSDYREDFYAVGEYWSEDLEEIGNYLDQTEFQIDLFDVKLHNNLHAASRSGDAYDLSTIFDGTLVKAFPDQAVTFVDNHDSQPGQALGSFVEPWFNPLAYALILLRQGGYPKIFYGDYYGVNGPQPMPGQREMIDTLCYLRAHHAYGEQIDHLDDRNLIGWVRLGDETHPYGCAVVMSNGQGGEKTMNVGADNAGAVFADYTGNRQDKITIGQDGEGVFPCHGGQVSVWVRDGVPAEEAVRDGERG